eukprot:RCo029511
MNSETFQLAGKLIAANYVHHATQGLKRVESLVQSLIAQRRLPDEGWNDSTVEHFMSCLSQMDSNNFVGNVGVGEREGRVWSSVVAKRHFYMTHGIGRSGDISANQPKAAGSSLLYSLTNLLALDALRLCGAKRTQQALVLPVATGMALSLVLQTLQALPALSVTAPSPSTSTDPGSSAPPLLPSSSPLPSVGVPGAPPRRLVVWSRIDQKTCLKCISTAGLSPVVVGLVRRGDALHTNLQEIERILQMQAAEVVCVLTTTSCFAPRSPDDVLAVSRLCQRYGVAHVINNAYGVQSEQLMKSIDSAMTHGRVDCYVQSTDKNFLVPVGGSVVASPHPSFIEALSQLYPGRASSSPIVDLFVTLVGMGRTTLRKLLATRKELLEYFCERIGAFAVEHGERLISDPRNDISLALSLDSLPPDSVSLLGSKLFYKSVSGPRVVVKGSRKSVCGIGFAGYGAHCDDFPSSYLAMACAIGVCREDIDVFMKRLEVAWRELHVATPPERASARPGRTPDHPVDSPLPSPGAVPPSGDSSSSSSSTLSSSPAVAIPLKPVLPKLPSPECHPVSGLAPPRSPCRETPSTELSAVASSCTEVTPVWVKQWMETCGSTMEEAKAAVDRHPDRDFVLVFARTQGKGRGTNNRNWLSPVGNVYMTVAIRKARLIPSREFLLPLETALVTLNAILRLEPHLSYPPKLKWPNDVVVNGQKISGCLIEEHRDYRLVGIGINVQEAPEVTDGGRPSGCLAQFGAKCSAEELAGAVFDVFLERLTTLHDGTRPELIAEWRAHVDWALPVHRRDAQRTLVRALEVTDWGQLIVEDANGRRETLTSEYLW